MTRQFLQHIREVALSLFTGSGTQANPIVTSSPTSLPATNAGYKFLSISSGPSGTPIIAIDMNTNSTATVSVFEYQVPAGQAFNFNRVNFTITDSSVDPGSFGGIAGGLPSGSLFEIIDNDGTTQLLDFSDGFAIQTNDDFVPLAGVDVPILNLAGDDLLPIRFSVFKGLGGPIRLTAGQRIRWTNRDNLTAITKFRAMVQGRLEDV